MARDADAVAALTEALILSGSEAALGAGEYDRAREMAITNAEVAKIEAARLAEPSITQI